LCRCFERLLCAEVVFFSFFHLAAWFVHWVWVPVPVLELKSAYGTGWMVVLFSIFAAGICGAVIFGGAA